MQITKKAKRYATCQPVAGAAAWFVLNLAAGGALGQPAAQDPAAAAVPAAAPASAAAPAAAASTPDAAASAPEAAASAPAPASAPAAAKSERVQLESVIVTANKRIERLEEVPLAISVLSSEQLERASVRSFEDVVALTPALTVTYGSTPANNGINMRGIGTSSIGIGVESDVAVILDDIPLGLQFLAFQDLTDILRVEVLKGPQSTLFGKSAIAGAVNIITKPVDGPLRGIGSALIASDRERRFRVAFGGDFSDTFGVRLAASTNNFPGNVNNLTTGSKVNGSEGRTLMGKIVWRPTSNLEVQLSPRYNHTETTCCALVLTNFAPVNGALLSNNAQLPATTLLAGITPGPDNRDIRNDAATGLTSSDKGVGLKISYSLPNGGLLTSITSAEKYSAEDSRDQDFVDVHTLLYYPLANGTPAGVDAGYTQYGSYRIKSSSQELRLTSPDEGSVRYVAGLWYAKNEIERHFVRGYNGIALTTPVQYFGTTYNKNTAIFGQATWAFLPDDTLLAGVRLNRQESGYTMSLGLPPPGDFVQTAYYESLGNNEDSTTGKLSYQHQFDKGLMAYVLGSTGYKGQAYDITSGLTAATAAQQPVPSERGRTIELGLKGNFLDNRVTLNLAAFHSKFSNYQQNSGGYLPGTTTFVTRLSTIGGVQTYGLEMDLAALVTPNFLFNASLAYTVATVTNWPNAPCYNTGGTANGGFNESCILKNPIYGGTNTQDVSGGVMPNAPKYKGSFSGKYDIPLNEGLVDFFLLGSVRFQSKVLTNINQDPTLGAPGYSIANAGFGIKDKADTFKLTFMINNLFDKRYANTGFTGLGSWSAKAPNPVVNVTTSTQTPARDSFRYASLRLDVKF